MFICFCVCVRVGGGFNKYSPLNIYISVPDPRLLITYNDPGGVSMLESRAGRFLCAEPDGTVVADRAVLSTWECFELESYEVAAPSAGCGAEGGGEGAMGSREVFAFRTFHGQYLRLADAADGSTEPGPGGMGLALSTAEEPTLWEIHTVREGVYGVVCKSWGLSAWIGFVWFGLVWFGVSVEVD